MRWNRWPGAAQIVTEKTDVAMPIGKLPHDGAQRCRLAGAVGAEHAHALALVDLKVDAVNHLDALVAGLQPGNLKHGQDRSPPSQDRLRSRADRGSPRSARLRRRSHRHPTPPDDEPAV